MGNVELHVGNVELHVGNVELHVSNVELHVGNVELHVGTATCLLYQQVISDYVTPPCKELSRDLDTTISPNIRYC